MEKAFYIRTFGCQMNRHDSERVAGILRWAGWHETAEAASADAIIFMTCCVREGAETRVHGHLGDLKVLKQQNPDLVIAVGGCMAQKEGERLLQRFPHMDLVFGTHQFTHIAELLEQAGRQPLSATALGGFELGGLPMARREGFRAWVPVTSGCNNFCSYCIVPAVRGVEKSRPRDEVIAEVAGLVDEGATEINLLGQNVNSYGRDIYGRPVFDELLRALDAHCPGIWLRFVTSHPRDFSDHIIGAIAECETVCEYIHLPIQAGSDRVLELMNRGYTKEYFLGRIARLRDAVPGCAISTDILLAFPGETEDDFLQTLDAVERSAFDSAFTFIYSPREGTPAADLPDTLPPEVKQDRFDRLQERLRAFTLESNLREEGRTHEVLVEGPSAKNPAMLTARTRHHKIVNFPGDENLAGRRVAVVIERAGLWSLQGRLATDQA